VETASVSSTVLATRNIMLARNGRQFAVLPDLQIGTGQSVAIVGPSGSGKTTALMALSGIRAPAEGDVTIDQTSLWKLSGSARARFRGQRIGLVFQSFHLIDAVSVAANLKLAARCAGLRPSEVRLDHLLHVLGIDDLRQRRADRISHGQAQRVAVARALFNKPAVVLADEPTSALDDAAAAGLLALLKEAAVSEGAGLVIATHDRRALGAVDQIVEMEAL